MMSEILSSRLIHRYLSAIAVTAVTTALIIVAVSKGIGSSVSASVSAAACMSRVGVAEQMKCLNTKKQACMRYRFNPDSGVIRNKEETIGTDPLRTYEGCMADVQPYIDQLLAEKAASGDARPASQGRQQSARGVQTRGSAQRMQQARPAQTRSQNTSGQRNQQMR